MSRFKVFINNTLVGYTEFESGDPLMGVAVGKFLPMPTYYQFQSVIVAFREGSQTHLSLHVCSALGQQIQAEGIQIIDYSAELGDDGFEVHILGIGYPLYEKLFPNHVAAYKLKWRS